MAAELRLILLGLGVALVVGLWWWERRRSDAPRHDGPVRNTELLEPRIEADVSPPMSALAQADSVPEDPATDMDTQEMPARRAPVLERPVPRGDPPIVTIDNLPSEAIDVVLESPELPGAATPAPAKNPKAGRFASGERRRVLDPPILDEQATYVPPAPPVLEVDAAPTEEPAEVEAADEEILSETPPRHQRIIAVRLLGRDGKRIDGGELKVALGTEGLVFGRYSIFHRVIDGGRPLYSVASLVEPGSFDPTVMDTARFPGVSMFAVFPGPLPAPQCFDELLATARRLADRLGATLQDDSGSSLTGQRVLSIREDLVHFEHLVALSRTRPRI